MTALKSKFVFVCIILVTNANSLLTDVKSNSSKNVENVGNTNCTDILRQLLNQETLIRMSLSKDVHTIMNEVMELKDKQKGADSKVTELKKEIEGLKQQNKQLKQENHVGNREIMQLKEQFAFIKEELIKINKTFKETEDSILKISENHQMFEIQVDQRQKNFETNTSEILKDIKIELRYMSVTLLDLNKHTLEIDKGIPKLVTYTFRSISRHLNKSLEELALNLASTQTKQMKLVSAITDLEGIQSNISKLTTDSVSQIEEAIQKQHYKQLEQTAKLATLEFKVNISSNMQRSTRKVHFSAAMTTSRSYSSSETIIFPKIITNVGNAYNSNTGTFTSPTDGTFVFYFSVYVNGNGYNRIDIVLNGVIKALSFIQESSGHDESSSLVVLQLKTGDKVWLKYNYGSYGIFANSNVMPIFSGFLI